MASKPALRAYDVDNALGVHTDITQGNWSDIDTMIAQARYAGIDTLRVGVPSPNNAWTSPYLDTLAKAGLKLEMLVDTRETPQANAALIAGFVKAHPGSVSFVEGPNEPSNWGVDYAGKSGTAGAQAWQKEFYAAMNADPATADITVAGPSSWIASASDVINVHPYAQRGDQPGSYIDRELVNMNAIDPGKGFVITETGYYTLPGANPNGVDEATQAKLVLNTYMDAVSKGAKSVGFFALRDWQNPDWDSFGLFHGDNSPKPAATALHNLESILTDGGAGAATFKPGTLDYTVTAPADVHSMLMQKSGGEFVLAVWREPDVWNEASMRATNPAGEGVHLQLAAAANVAIYDPLTGTGATKTAAGVTALDLTVVDHPVFLSLTASAALPPTTPPPAPQPTPSASTITGDGADNRLVGDARANTILGLAGNDRLLGNGGDDVLTGGDGKDTLSGGAGNDLLQGGTGADMLEGGAGADHFRFITPADGGDTIRDFVHGQDVIEFASWGFGGVPVGAVTADHFTTNTTGQATAPAGTAQFIYESDQPKLWWDKDGAGGAAAIRIATFDHDVGLTASDLHVLLV